MDYRDGLVRDKGRATSAKARLMLNTDMHNKQVVATSAGVGIGR